MKIQVCRNCGHKNTVVSGPFTSCNYCGSTELDPVMDTALPPGAAVADTSSDSGLKWIIVIVLLLVTLGAAAWWGTTYFSDDKPLNIANKSIPVKNALNQQAIPEDKNLKRPAEQNLVEKKNIAVVEPTPQKEEKIALIKEQPKSIQLKTEPDINKQLNSIESTQTISAAQALVVEDEVAEMKQTQSISTQDVKSTTQNLSVAPQQVKEVIAKKEKPEVRVKSKKMVQEKVKKVAVKKPVKQVTKQVKPVKKTENEATAELQLKREQEKVKKLQALLDSKEAKERRRNMRSINRSQGVVTDAKTRLMWMTCSIGQNWNGGSCAGEPEEYLWSEAVSLAKDKNYAGHSDWRLPTRDELHSIVSCTNDRLDYKLATNGKTQIKNGVPQNGKCLGKFKRPVIDQRVFPNTSPNLYWSYSFNARTNYSAWGVFFSTGHHYDYNTTNVGLVRLVRNY